MVKNIWARCDWCKLKTFDRNDIHVLSCKGCSEDNENFYFHKCCINSIYDKNKKRIFRNFQKYFDRKVKCKKCLCEEFTIEMLW